MAKKRRGRPVNGVLIVDKPTGQSSNRSLQIAKRLRKCDIHKYGNVNWETSLTVSWELVDGFGGNCCNATFELTPVPAGTLKECGAESAYLLGGAFYATLPTRC